MIDDFYLDEGTPTEFSGIYALEGFQDGPSVGLMGLLHGNESAGVGLWDLIRRVGRPKRGRLFLILGHPEAFDHQDGPRRSIEHDINRLFHDSLTSDDRAKSPDHARCLDLMRFFDQLDILIDIHSTSSPTEPFVVVPGKRCDHARLATDLPITQLFGLHRFLPRTATHWMVERGRTGVTIEVGKHDDPEGRQTAAAMGEILLESLGMIEAGSAYFKRDQDYEKRSIAVLGRVETDSSRFAFTKCRGNFGRLMPNEVIAVDGDKTFQAPNLDHLVICMPTSMEVLQETDNVPAYYLGIDLESILGFSNICCGFNLG